MRIPVFRVKATSRNMPFHQTNVSMCGIFAYAVLGLFFFPPYSQAQALLKRSPDSHGMIIKFKPGSQLLKTARSQSDPGKQANVASALSQFGITRLQPVKPDATLDPLPGGVERIFVAHLSQNRELTQGLGRSRALSDIEYAEPVSSTSEGHGGIKEIAELQGSEVASGFPNDPAFPKQWALDNPRRPGSDLRMLNAWGITTGSKDIVVAFLSTGLRTDAFEFLGRVLRNGYNFVDENTDLSDVQVTGTFVAGVTAATGNNSVAMAGVDWKCSILPLKVHTTYPTYGPPSLDRLVRGIVFAADNRANVVCIPWYGELGNLSINDAIDYASSRGVIIVLPVCEGTGRYERYPDSFSKVLLVGAVNELGQRYQSCYGQIDFVAPGAMIMGLSDVNPAYARMTLGGPSMAAAIATGVVSLMLSMDSRLTFSDVYEILKESSMDQVGNPKEDKPGWDEYYGWGRINAYRALRIIQERSKAVPQAFGVSQNYPNPFNSSTVIQYELRYPTHVSITIYNVLGQPVVTLLDEEKQAGYHHVRWDANVASGVYIYRLNARPPSGGHAGERVIVKKMILMK